MPNKFIDLLTPTPHKLIVISSLVLILMLVYLKTNKLELFLDSIIETTTSPITSSPAIATIPNISLLNNDIIQNSALANFINKFIINKQHQNLYAATLANRQNNINKLSAQVVNLIN